MSKVGVGKINPGTILARRMARMGTPHPSLVPAETPVKEESPKVEPVKKVEKFKTERKESKRKPKS